MAQQTRTQANKKTASSDSFVMLGDAKHDGDFYKKGQRVTLDGETQEEFAKLGLIDSPLASDVAAKPSDDQTQGSDSAQVNTGANEGKEGGEGGNKEKGDEAKAGKETK